MAEIEVNFIPIWCQASFTQHIYACIFSFWNNMVVLWLYYYSSYKGCSSVVNMRGVSQPRTLLNLLRSWSQGCNVMSEKNHNFSWFPLIWLTMKVIYCFLKSCGLTWWLHSLMSLRATSGYNWRVGQAEVSGSFTHKPDCHINYQVKALGSFPCGLSSFGDLCGWVRVASGEVALRFV